VSSGTRFPVGIIAIDAEGKTPTIWAWSLGVQQQLPGQLVLDVSYVGNVARHLMYQRDINTLPLGMTVNTPILTNANNTTQAIRPFKGFTGINFIEYAASSNYHGLQTRVSRRFGTSLTFNVNYTWSKAIDETDTDTTTIPYFLDRLRERAAAGYDRTHVFTIDYIYSVSRLGRLGNHAVTNAVLGGWQISGVTRFWSGLPFTVGSNGNAGTLGGGPRANYLGGNIILKDTLNRQWFDPLVFGRPKDGELGNTGRNFLRGPGFANFDFSLFKDFKVAERVKLQYRAEIFNLFNHLQWFGISTGISATNPDSAVTAATRGTSGQLTSARDSRKIQMAMKLFF